MLLGYASNLPFGPPFHPQTNFLPSWPCSVPQRLSSMGSITGFMQAVGLANKGTGRRSKTEEREEEESSASSFPSGSGLHFLAMAESLQGCSSCQRAPPLWPQLSPWTPGMNAISSLCSWPSSDSSFPLLLVSGWQEPHVTLNSVYSSGNNPFIKVFWTIYTGLFLLPDLRIQTTDL